MPGFGHRGSNAIFWDYLKEDTLPCHFFFSSNSLLNQRNQLIISFILFNSTCNVFGILPMGIKENGIKEKQFDKMSSFSLPLYDFWKYFSDI